MRPQLQDNDSSQYAGLLERLGRLEGKILQVPTVSSLPSNPINGQIAYYQDAVLAAKGAMWQLRYNALSASPYKWELAGGTPLLEEVPTGQTLTGTVGTYVDLGTVGPSVTVPLAGDYKITGGAWITWSVGETTARASIKFGSAATTDNEQVAGDYGVIGATVGAASHGMRTMRRNSIAAATVLKMQYKVDANSAGFYYRHLSILPFRVG